MEQSQKKNKPTQFEMILAYIVWAIVALSVYNIVLKPKGWTIKKGIQLIKGKKSEKKVESNKNKKKITQKKISTVPKVIKPTPSPMKKRKKVIKRSSMSLSEDDD